jgi:hypothetical protein
MQPDRTAPPVKPRAVRYSPLGPVAAVGVPLLCVGVFVASLLGFIASARDVRVQCERVTGTCRVVSSWLGAYTQTRTFDLASLRGARLDASRTKNGHSYEVVLLSTQGDEPISSRGSAYADARRKQKEALDGFLRDPRQRDIDVVYDEASAESLLWLAFGLAWLFAAWGARTSVRIEVDHRARELTVVTVRTPLPSKRRTYPMDRVRGAVVTEVRGTRGGARYTAALVLDGEEQPVPLTSWGTSDRTLPALAVAGIGELLRDERPG